MSAKKWDLVIVGGGAGGLVLALALAQKGLQIALLDQKSPPIPPPRGEILQPNGLRILDELGLLNDLLAADVHRNRAVHFYRTSGQHLCTIDYARLPGPYAYALILLPEVLQRRLLEALTRHPNIHTYWGARFQSVLWEDDRVVGVEADRGGKPLLFQAPVVVGGDGAGSRVRNAFGIRHRARQYADGYFTTVVDRPQGMKEDSRYYLGKRTIFGAFPVSQNRTYLFYMIPRVQLEAVKARGLDSLKDEMLSLHPEIASLFSNPLKAILSWDQCAFMPCFRVNCAAWTVKGGALIGDAAHAMNPHVAQGRNAAMEDAMVLARVLGDCYDRGDFSQEALSAYERARRPDVDLLQGLGNEMTALWNSGFPPLVWARDRIFRSVQRHASLHDKMLGTVAGLHLRPLNLSDRWKALCSTGGSR